MVLQAAGLPSEHSSTSTSRQTFTYWLRISIRMVMWISQLLECSSLKLNLDTPAIGTQLPTPPNTPFMPPKCSCKTVQSGSRLVKIRRILHFRFYINLLAAVCLFALRLKEAVVARLSSSLQGAAPHLGGHHLILTLILGYHHLILGYSGISSGSGYLDIIWEIIV